jgi:hypothetical protein
MNGDSGRSIVILVIRIPLLSSLFEGAQQTHSM